MQSTARTEQLSQASQAVPNKLFCIICSRVQGILQKYCLRWRQSNTGLDGCCWARMTSSMRWTALHLPRQPAQENYHASKHTDYRLKQKKRTQPAHENHMPPLAFLVQQAGCAYDSDDGEDHHSNVRHKEEHKVAANLCTLVC